MSSIAFGGKKYLWGNVPAIDVVQLEKNEGAHYEGNLRLLFAASGDMRNVLETMRCLPLAYRKPLFLHINDKDLDIVARNLIVTLAAFVALDNVEAVDFMLNIWYSALITKSHADFLWNELRPLIADVVLKIERKPQDTMLGKTWVSNITDVGYLGMLRTAACLGPLLDAPADNPYSTLISAFLNAVDETERSLADAAMQTRDMARAIPFLGCRGNPKSRYDPKVALSTAAKDLMRDGTCKIKTLKPWSGYVV
nr:hypothetical protein B0A51_13954 [Rachicladosporium sp. CCFEE 5018]